MFVVVVGGGGVFFFRGEGGVVFVCLGFFLLVLFGFIFGGGLFGGGGACFVCFTLFALGLRGGIGKREREVLNYTLYSYGLKLLFHISVYYSVKTKCNKTQYHILPCLALPYCMLL